MLVDRWSRRDFSEPGQLPHRVSKYSSHLPLTFRPEFLTFRHLANRSFQKPLVQDYISRCSTLWGRFLCMIVRSIDRAQSMLFFDDEQVVATLALLDALQDGKGVTLAIYELSYRMATHPAVIDRCRSPFYQFLVTVHLRTDSRFDHPYSISLNMLMLQLCIRVTVIERAQHLVHLHHFDNLVE
jgi:hypothetical protein